MSEKETLHWIDSETGQPIHSIEDMPKNVIGFVYQITYVDGMRYIGKKNLYTTQAIPSRKSGEARPNCIYQEKRIRNHKRILHDICKAESNWKIYMGSHKEGKIRIAQMREILQYAYTNLHLTYLEAKWLFQSSVLERTDFLNDNILGKFYRNVNDPNYGKPTID